MCGGYPAVCPLLGEETRIHFGSSALHYRGVCCWRNSLRSLLQQVLQTAQVETAGEHNRGDRKQVGSNI